MSDDVEPWFSVRCVLAFESDETTFYEERVTLWRAGSFDAAIERAEAEAREYVVGLDGTYIGLGQAFHLAVGDRIGDGDEVFSMMRESELSPDDYISHFFDTGRENNRDDSA